MIEIAEAEGQTI